MTTAADPTKPNPALFDPALAQEQAPEKFRAKFETTKGDFVMEITRDWSPNGADRLYNLVKIGYFTDVPFFRVVPNFMAQFGVHGDPKVNRSWGDANIQDDKVIESNQKGYVTFAKTGAPNSRSTQLYINYRDNSNLDGMGFAPIGQVVDGMAVVDSLYSGYGDGPPHGRGPNQMRFKDEGNAYLKKDFPNLDYIKQATLIE
ncbi:MAG: peptidylprolyl isomerase [Planctomycetota bacterium]